MNTIAQRVSQVTKTAVEQLDVGGAWAHPTGIDRDMWEKDLEPTGGAEGGSSP
jgi:hypothetical protein